MTLSAILQAALFYVLKESFKVYKAISEGLINLSDKFFDMDYFNAQKALEIYKESIHSAERLQVTWLLLAASQYVTCSFRVSSRLDRWRCLPVAQLPAPCKVQGVQNYATEVLCRLQAFYRESESLDDIKRVINFPKLEMPPADFLQNMEEYAKQAPRQFDDSGPKKVRARHCWVPASPEDTASA